METKYAVLNNGVKMPTLGLGVWRVQDGSEVINAVKWAIEAGYRSIDTAAIYQNEDGVGTAIKESGISRDEIFVTTKVWNSDQGFERTLNAFEESRKRLSLEYIDLYLVHWPIAATYRQTWKALVKLYNEGHVKAIGVSNFNEQHITMVAEETGVMPAVNQVQLHPLYTQKRLLSFANENNIKLTAWSPLMKGNLDLPLLRELSSKYKKTPAQVVLRWHIQNDVIVIPKSINKERIIENSMIFDFELSSDDMKRIDRLCENKFFGTVPDGV